MGLSLRHNKVQNIVDLTSDFTSAATFLDEVGPLLFRSLPICKMGTVLLAPDSKTVSDLLIQKAVAQSMVLKFRIAQTTQST